MWTGGVRVIILDQDQKVLMVRHQHPERQIWTVPGGAIEENETAAAAAVREVKEETGLDVAVGQMLWHVEQVTADKGQRFVNIFQASILGGTLQLGTDPERDGDVQVLREVCFMSREDLAKADGLYPDYLKDELWEILDNEEPHHDPFKLRK